jgi:hypothetical protein
MLGRPDHDEQAEVYQLKRIADELEKIHRELHCICKALQPPKAQSATLVITPKEK